MQSCHYLKCIYILCGKLILLSDIITLLISKIHFEFDFFAWCNIIKKLAYIFNSKKSYTKSNVMWTIKNHKVVLYEKNIYVNYSIIEVIDKYYNIILYDWKSIHFSY